MLANSLFFAAPRKPGFAQKLRRGIFLSKLCCERKMVELIGIEPTTS